jgi:hypothetical protein
MYLRRLREHDGEVKRHSMHTETVVEGVARALVIVAAIAMSPDFVRYMKIRAM